MRWLLLSLGCSLGCAAAAADGAPDDAASDARTPSSEAGSSGSDAGVDSLPVDVGTTTDGKSGFPAGEGIEAALDRSEPCTKAEVGSFRAAPRDGDTVQACLPNYLVWAPVACGGPRPPCACDATHCLPGEAAKLVSGEFCICLARCTTQKSGARCGAVSSRACIPVDDVTGKQVFVCGG